MTTLAFLVLQAQGSFDLLALPPLSKLEDCVYRKVNMVDFRTELSTLDRQIKAYLLLAPKKRKVAIRDWYVKTQADHNAFQKQFLTIGMRAKDFLLNQRMYAVDRSKLDWLRLAENKQTLFYSRGLIEQYVGADLNATKLLRINVNPKTLPNVFLWSGHGRQEMAFASFEYPMQKKLRVNMGKISEMYNW